MAKSFREQAAEQFMSKPVKEVTPFADASKEAKTDEPVLQAPAHRKAPKKPKKAHPEYKLDPRYIEKRTRRLQLILQPSLYERVKGKARELDVSVNDYIHNILDEATKNEER